MSGFDSTSTYVTRGLTSGIELPSDSNTEIINKFKQFILDFRFNNNNASYMYRDQLRNNLLLKQFFLQVNIDHIINYNDVLYRKLIEEPTDIIPLFEIAVNEAAKRIAFSVSSNNTDVDPQNAEGDPTSQAMLDGGLADSEVLYDLNNGVTCQLILDGGQNDLSAGNSETDAILNDIKGGDNNIVTNDTENERTGDNNTNVAIRNLSSAHVSKLVRISGIIVSASVLTSRASTLTIVCRNCRHTTKIHLNNFNSLTGANAQARIPRSCLSQRNNADGITGDSMRNGQQGSAQQITSDEQASCGNDPYIIIHESSNFIDQQYLKIQELPESVPVGEMPRTILMTCDRYLTNKLIPGTRVNVLGIYSIYQSKSTGGPSNGGSSGRTGSGVAIRNPYVKMVGMNLLTAGGRIHSLGDDEDVEAEGNLDFGSLLSNGNNIFSGVQISDSDEQLILELSRNPRVYKILRKSLASSIFGNDDIKRAILCLLFGGSKKTLPDGMRLRGDVNVLMLGDPGTAKSQLLKFVEKVAPISVYTSGKGSSAAGLTASVQRDPNTRDFYLEGGAMVLADGGVVCIDEFDKMRDEDRVAIHEAMEQQTISVAKAGITTVLNSRTSVLAAANPIYGRYNDAKSPGENIDFQTTILSRFDMIFIVKDAHDEQRDINIANHVMNIHTGRGNNDGDSTDSEELSLEFFKKYIAYCRGRCAPRLSEEASQRLIAHFVEIRKKVQLTEIATGSQSTIPITVRQLEAIVRISESLAKMQLSPTANSEHVNEAIRLFQASTMDAASYDMEVSTIGINNDENSGYDPAREMRMLEDEIKRRFPIGFITNYTTLKKEFVEKRKFKQSILDRALFAMESREQIQFSNGRKKIHRIGV